MWQIQVVCAMRDARSHRNRRLPLTLTLTLTLTRPRSSSSLLGSGRVDAARNPNPKIEITLDGRWTVETFAVATKTSDNDVGKWKFTWTTHLHDLEAFRARRADRAAVHLRHECDRRRNRDDHGVKRCIAKLELSPDPSQ